MMSLSKDAAIDVLVMLLDAVMLGENHSMESVDAELFRLRTFSYLFDIKRKREREKGMEEGGVLVG